ncbi:NAD(P)/FAD-dependent oxidoreductase [Patescibacteria group bacterium]|nr:NAD(P)/FAD-dependent oxidoreductase [Patescibacteria group bacterium]
MRVAIIGGGAAGMMAAATINEVNPGIEVFLIEKNESLGKKVLISGGGRCNITTGIEDIKIVLKNYPRGEKFLTPAMHCFSPLDVRDWFGAHGVPQKCGEDLRVFPKSNDGRDVLRVFEKIFSRHRTKIFFGHAVKSILKSKNGFVIKFTEHPPLEADRVVLALGGRSYQHTGSAGDGYALAQSLGHKISPLAASLHSFVTKEKWPREVSGLTIAKAFVGVKSQKRYHTQGGILFTHWGVSGPAIFALSSLTAFLDFSPANPLDIFIDLLPDLSAEKIIADLKDIARKNPKKNFKNTVHNFVPRTLAEIIARETGIHSQKKNAEVSNTEIEKVGQWFKFLPLQIVGRGAGEEFVTAGGVELDEVNPHTMESKICSGLYFAGEILNIDGFTGGFNLQAAWATGRAAGDSLAKNKK